MKISAKEIASLVRSLSKSANTSHFTSAIIAAGGCGSRMESGDKTKQMLDLCGIPVVVRTLLAFEECELIDEIIVSAKMDELQIYEEFKEKYSLTKLSKVVVGGDTRQESVLNGFEAINDKSEFVAIHDGARCLITKEDIEKVLRAAYNHGAATAACRAVDTVKNANKFDFITDTPDRDLLWLAQTPQVFKTEVYRAAAYIAKDEGFAATDDNLLVEHIGFPIKLVDCTSRNIKLTTKYDLAVATALLNMSDEGKQ